MSERTTLDAVREGARRLVAAGVPWPPWAPGTRPTDAQLNQAFEDGDAMGAAILAAIEMDRARAAEEALTARVAELEAAAAGETGTPKAEGQYWCESDGLARYAAGKWWRVTGLELEPHMDAPGRFHRLPGETYEGAP